MTDRKTKQCEYCGEDMFIADGNTVRYIDKIGKVRTYKNPDQEARYHRKCRAAGRRQNNK